MNIITDAWATTMNRLQALRAALATHKRLESELASYATPAERMELDAMLARHEPVEVADIHRIIDRHRAA